MIRIAVFLAALHAASALAASPPEAASIVLRVTQVNSDSQAIGTPQEAPCPVNGCQVTTMLKVSSANLAMTAVVTFAGQGTYLALETPRFAPRISPYGDTRAAPIFLPKFAGRTIARTIPLTVQSQNATLGATPDAFLRIELSAAPAAPQS